MTTSRTPSLRNTFILLRLPAVLGLCLGLLSGCLVNPDKVIAKEYGITVDLTYGAQLRIYQDLDRNEYVVSGFLYPTGGGVTDLFGNMYTFWEPKLDLNDQFNGPLVDAMRERTVMSLELDTIITTLDRYISQAPIDATDPLTLGLIGGTKSLIGIADNTVNGVTWATDGAGTSVRAPVPVFWSPMEQDIIGIDTNDHAQTFYMINECDSVSTCKPNGSVSYTQHQIVARVMVNTLYGRFDTYRIDYSGTFNPIYDGQPTLPDIRAHCYDGSVLQVSFSGSMYVHPEVGMVKMDNTCSAAGLGTTILNWELTHTTIPLTPLP